MTQESYMNSLKLECGSAIIQTQWTESVIRISLLLPKPNAIPLGFSGELLMSQMEDMAKCLDRSWVDFLDETKRALRTENGLADFQYECNETKLTFTWRKIGDSHRKVIKLTPRDGLCYELLRNSMLVVSVLNEHKQNMEIELVSLQKRYDTIKKAYEECIKEKRTIEDGYLTKFLLLLNTKKAKIRELSGSISQKRPKIDSPSFSFNTIEEEVGESRPPNPSKPSASATLSDLLSNSLRKRSRNGNGNANMATETRTYQPATSTVASSVTPKAMPTVESSVLSPTSTPARSPAPMRLDETSDMHVKVPSKASSPPKAPAAPEEVARSSRNGDKLLEEAKMLLEETECNIYDMNTEFFGELS